MHLVGGDNYTQVRVMRVIRRGGGGQTTQQEHVDEDERTGDNLNVSRD